MIRLSTLILVVTLLAQPALAAVSCSLLTSGSSGANTDIYATASITPTANQLILLAVDNARNAAAACTTADITGVTGNSLTWVKINEQCFSDAGAPTHMVTLYRTMGASPTTEAVSINYGGNAQNSAAWVVLDCSGTDTTGTNGSGAVVQSDINLTEPGTSLAMSLAAFGSANNATLAVFSVADNIAVTHEGTFTELSEVQVSDGGLDHTLQVEFLVSNDTSPSASFSSIDAGGIAIEIKAAPGGGGGSSRPRGAVWLY